MAEEKPQAKKEPSKRRKLYEVFEGKVKRKSKFCPKCGDGVFMAKHQDRYSCGKCGYSESRKKSE